MAIYSPWEYLLPPITKGKLKKGPRVYRPEAKHLLPLKSSFGGRFCHPIGCPWGGLGDPPWGSQGRLHTQPIPQDSGFKLTLVLSKPICVQKGSVQDGLRGAIWPCRPKRHLARAPAL